MSLFPFFSVVMIIIYFAIIFTVLFLIYKWINRIISLKQEHNELLREIIKNLKTK